MSGDRPPAGHVPWEGLEDTPLQDKKRAGEGTPDHERLGGGRLLQETVILLFQIIKFQNSKDQWKH